MLSATIHQPATAPGSAPHRAAPPDTTAVLVFDARPAALDAIATALRRDGQRVLAAVDLASALELLARERPAAALVHRACAAGALRHLRGTAPGLPIIVHGHADAGDPPLAGDGGIALVDGDAPERLREALACLLAAARCVDRQRHEQELQGLALVQLCHTLRAPLDVIQGYAELLRENQGGADGQMLLDGLICAVANAMKLTREHLALASLDTPDAAVRSEPLDVDTLLADLRRAAARPLAGRRLRLVASAPYRGAMLVTDGDKLRALLAQLLMRAAETSPRGVLRLTLRAGVDATFIELVDRPSAAACRARGTAEALGDPLTGDGLELVQRLAGQLGVQLGSRRGPTGAVVFTVLLPAPLTLLPAAAEWGTLH